MRTFLFWPDKNLIKVLYRIESVRYPQSYPTCRFLPQKGVAVSAILKSIAPVSFLLRRQLSKRGHSSMFRRIFYDRFVSFACASGLHSFKPEAPAKGFTWLVATRLMRSFIRPAWAIVLCLLLTAAPSPAAEPPAAAPSEKKEPTHKGGVVTEEAKKYWAYQPIKRPRVPEVADKVWVANPIDAFILAKLEAKDLKPAKAADPVALIRRATYDLTGLPPTPDEVADFVKASATAPGAAYEKLIDRLLASAALRREMGPALARRRSLCRDQRLRARRSQAVCLALSRLRHPQFQRRQAVRSLRQGTAGGRRDSIATIPIALSPPAIIGSVCGTMNRPIACMARFDELDDWVATTGQAFLAMTMNCARCHEHKIDPIPHADYYRMLAFFQDVRRFSNSRDTRSAANLTDITPANARKPRDADWRQLRERLAQLNERDNGHRRRSDQETAGRRSARRRRSRPSGCRQKGSEPFARAAPPGISQAATRCASHSQRKLAEPATCAFG